MIDNEAASGGGALGFGSIRWAGICSLAWLSSCAGVPQLYRPAATARPQTDIAPKVEHIVERIRCELAGASALQLKGRSYVVTVLLTLQVDDELNLTPSLSFISPLSATGTNRTITEGLGIGGARQRVFSSTFYFDTDELRREPACDDDPRRLYRLDGHLGLADIARDGAGIADQQVRNGRPAPPKPPSFGSSVKFVVTRSVGALGPTWTLVTFKGPGGATGLLNGKALSTDVLNVVFSPKTPEAPSPESKRQIELLQRLVELLERREAAAAAEADERRKVVQKEEGRQKFLSARDPAGRLRSQRDLAAAREELSAAERARTEAREARTRSEIELQSALDAAAASSARSRGEAIRNGQEFITTQILQTLNVQPR